MGADSKIQWTDHTFNPWWGCTKVSPGCDHCYAETFDRRVGGAHWGKGAPRREFGQKHWNEPLKWNAVALRDRKPMCVFCASMADWTDAEAPAGAVEQLHALWRATPWLQWLMLTKRPARIARCLPPDWGHGYANVWLGTTVDDVKHGLPRIDVLQNIPARVRFLSVEPQVEDLGNVYLDGIHWVIMGGESGPGARPYDPQWARDILHQCRMQGAAPFVKQMGAVWARTNKARLSDGRPDTHGGNWDNWPSELRVREFPEAL